MEKGYVEGASAAEAYWQFKVNCLPQAQVMRILVTISCSLMSSTL